MTRAAVVVLLVAALAGCGSASGSSLDEAADATAAETSRFEMHYRIADPELEKLNKGQSFEFEAEGVFDYPNERGLMTVSGKIPFFEEGATPTEFRLLGQIGYTRWMVKGKSYWIKEDAPAESDDPVELLIPFPGSPTKPTDVLTRVLLASDDQRELGEADVRGTETTRYSARVDLQKLVQQLPPSQRPGGDVESYWGERFVPVEIWIDSESRLRRITIDQSSKEENGTSKMSTTVELFDYGVEFDVQPPPSEELISQEELDKLMGDSGELSVGEAGELSPQKACESAREHLPEKDADEICAELKEKQ